MKDRAFIDTNILLYLYTQDEGHKKLNCEKMLFDYDWVISIQVINEFSNIMIRKLSADINEIKNIIEDIIKNFEICEISTETVFKALDLKNKYKYSYYDSLILSSAIENGCKVTFSEDMHDNQKVETTTIINPCK